MQYTIQQIVPSQIVVQFEDGTRTVVAISSEATPEEIDNFVSFYDPDFFPDPATLINPNVSVGEVRMSNRITPENRTPPESEPEVSPLLNLINPLEDPYLVFGAQQLAAAGNTAVLDRILQFVGPFSEAELQSRLDLIEENREEAAVLNAEAQEEAEDIFDQAMKELM